MQYQTLFLNFGYKVRLKYRQQQSSWSCVRASGSGCGWRWGIKLFYVFAILDRTFKIFIPREVRKHDPLLDYVLENENWWPCFPLVIRLFQNRFFLYPEGKSKSTSVEYDGFSSRLLFWWTKIDGFILK